MERGGGRDRSAGAAAFPVVAARTLLGADVTLPAGFPAARTLTVYTDVRAFQRALCIAGSDDVTALVVDRDGAVMARGNGEPDDESWAAVAVGLLPG